MTTVLLFTGGDAPPLDSVGELPRPDLVVAADGGYDSAMALGYAVDVLVGDLDSIVNTDIPDHVVVERHPRDKDATDLELALELVARDSPSRLVVVGGSGGRLDHELGVAQLLCSPRWHQIDELDWVSASSVAHVIDSRRLLHADVGNTLSLIPIGGDVSGVATKGLKWNLANEPLIHGNTRGLSNVVVSPVVDVRIASGCLLGVFPKS